MHCARSVLNSTEKELQQISPLQESPDGHWEFILHACVFLLKLESPGFRDALPGLVDGSTIDAISRMASLFASLSRSSRDTPALYHGLLRSLLSISTASIGNSPVALLDQQKQSIDSRTHAYAKTLINSKAWTVSHEVCR